MNSKIIIGMTVLLGVFYCWTSRINGMFFFGRTADAELRASEAGRAIRRQYLTGIALATVAAAFMVWAGGHSGHRSLSAASILIEVLVFSVIFAWANGQVQSLTQGRVLAARESVIRVALLEQPTYWIPGIVAILLPLAICVGAVAVTVFLSAHGAGMSAGWKTFSDSMDGQGSSGVLGFATGLLVAAAGTLLVFRSTVRLRTKMAQYTVRSCISIEWVATAMLVATLVCNRLGIVISREVGKGAMLTGLAVAIATMTWNQARSKRFVPPPVEVGGDDRWRWGLFYVDRSDPALFVQSRCGAGYTLNYGRVLAWPISLGIVAYLVCVLFFLPHHH